MKGTGTELQFYRKLKMAKNEETHTIFSCGFVGVERVVVLG